jgi:hypothetical protein
MKTALNILYCVALFVIAILAYWLDYQIKKAAIRDGIREAQNGQASQVQDE